MGKTYAIYINACSHCGCVDAAENVWRNEIVDDGLKWNSYVVTAMIDCLARNGELNKAYAILKEWTEYNEQFDIVEEKNDIAMWLSLLSGCRRHKNSKLAQTVHDEFERYTQQKYGDLNQASVQKYIESAKILLANTFAHDLD